MLNAIQAMEKGGTLTLRTFLEDGEELGWRSRYRGMEFPGLI